MKYLISMLTVAMVGVASAAAWASVTAGSVQLLSASANVARDRPTTLTVRWTVERTVVSAPTAGTVSSTKGEFVDGSGRMVLGTVERRLSRTLLPATRGASTVYTFTETLTVPRSVLFQAHRLGLSQIQYRRAFTDCPGAECAALDPAAAVTLNITGAAAGGFSVSRLQLRFEDEATRKIVRPDERFRALARVQVSGSGVLKAVWEIATPSSTAGTPVFRTLEVIRRQVGSGAVRTLRSPVLPVSQYGMYLLRLRIDEPAPEQAVPMLQYLVIQGRPAPAVTRIAVQGPPAGAGIDQRTLFQWTPVPEVRAYKLEFRRHGVEAAPVTGMMIEAGFTQVSPSTLVMSRLPAGRYEWRIVAFDGQGVVTARSDWQPVQVQP